MDGFCQALSVQESQGEVVSRYKSAVSIGLCGGTLDGRWVGGWKNGPEGDWIFV